MVAKIMCLLLIWYYVSMVPGWTLALKCIKKRVIWRNGIPKVAKATLRLPKQERGLNVWSLVDKANAFTTIWVIKVLLSKTNPILESTIQAATNWYAAKSGTQVPL
jgi:hypothetical protein